MGFTGTILAAKPANSIDVERLLVQFDFLEPESVEDGWVIDEAYRHPRQAQDYFRDVVEAFAGPTLVVEVAHSDLAYLIAGSPGTEPVVVVLTLRAFRAEGVPLPSSRAQRAAVEAFVEWSSVAPRPITVDRMQALIKAGNTFAEDLVWELLDVLRIRRLPDSDPTSSPDIAGIERVGADDLTGYLKPVSWMGDQWQYADRDVPWSEYRFIPGHGNGFCGIWDRREPSAPLLTYPNDLRGREALSQDLADLDARLDLGQASDAFDGMIGLLGHLGGFFPGGREFQLVNSRFLPGWGNGFAGVWDQDGGSQPVVRFKGGDRARDRALDWTHVAMMRILAEAKVIGPDRWVSSYAEIPFEAPPMDRFAVFLVAFEEADPTWPPNGVQGMEVDGFLIHQIVKMRDGFDIQATSDLPDRDPDVVKRRAMEWNASGDWVRVPDTVSSTLFETARWAVEESPFAQRLIPHPERS
jgi:hypothetical protein